MKYIALLLILANVGFFFFHDEIVQKPAQIEPAPLPKDVPQLKLVKEINKEQPNPVVAAVEPQKTEKPISDNSSPESKNKEIQIVAIAQPDTVSQEDPVKIAAQAFDVLKVLKKEADRMTSSIDQAVSTPPITTNPPETKPDVTAKVEPPKVAEKPEKAPEPAKTSEKTTLAEQKVVETPQKPVEEPKVVEKTTLVEKVDAPKKAVETPKPVEKIEQIPAKPVETKVEEKPKTTVVEKTEEKTPPIEKVEPVKIVEKPISSETKPETETDGETSSDKLPITLAASKKEDKKNKKSCYYSGIYEKKYEATQAKQWLDKQKVSSKVKDWKNRVKSGRTVFLPAASHEVAKKLLKRLALKKVKDYTLVRNEKGGYLINLGAFRTEKTLQNRLSELKKKGFVGLKIQDRYLDVPVFRLRIEATPSQRSVLDNFSLTFKVPKPQSIACEQ
jgi:hypothetical protein